MDCFGSNYCVRFIKQTVLLVNFCLQITQVGVKKNNLLLGAFNSTCCTVPEKWQAFTA